MATRWHELSLLEKLWYNYRLTWVSRKEYQQNCWYHCSTTSVIRKMYQWFLVPRHWSGSLAKCISKWYYWSLTLVSKKMYQENCWYHCSPNLVSWKMYQHTSWFYSKNCGSYDRSYFWKMSNTIAIIDKTMGVYEGIFSFWRPLKNEGKWTFS